MVKVTATTQLSTFSLIRAALIANSTLSSKFNNSNIYEYEPKHKSVAFKGFPYIWINIPTTEDSYPTFDHGVAEKEFGVDLFLRVEYQARDKFLEYANAILRAVEEYQSTFDASGYKRVSITLENTDPNIVIEQKELVEGTFSITFLGKVID